jgi:hypothetical protein
MRHVIQTISVLLLTALSPFAFAQVEDCPRPDAIDITLDGNSTSEEEFAAAQAQVQNYNNAATIFLQCLEQVGANTPEEEQQPLIDAYNDMATELQNTLNAFNRQARVYSARMSSIESADDCIRPETINPDVDGSTATEEAMMEARTMVQNYHQAATNYLECLQLAAQVVPPEEQDNLVELYNGMAAEMEDIIVNDFNVQIRAYQARMSEAAEEAQ